MLDSGAPRKTAIDPRMVFLVLAGAVVIAHVVLGASLLRHQAKQHDLTSQLDFAEAVLITADNVRQQTDTLPASLTEASDELAAAQAAFPSELDSNDRMQTLLALADQSEVSVLSMDTVPPAPESPGETDVSMSRTFDLQIAGELGRVIQFVGALGEGALGTTTISTLALQQTGGLYVLDVEVIAHARSPTGESSSPEDEGSTGEETGTASEGEDTPSE